LRGILHLLRVTTLQTIEIPCWFVARLRGTWHVKCYSYHACTRY